VPKLKCSLICEESQNLTDAQKIFGVPISDAWWLVTILFSEFLTVVTNLAAEARRSKLLTNYESVQ
jgi:hypothetical protein